MNGAVCALGSNGLPLALDASRWTVLWKQRDVTTSRGCDTPKSEGLPELFSKRLKSERDARNDLLSRRRA